MVRLGSVVRSLPEGKLDLAVKYFPRLHLPSTGTTAAGSDVLRDVTNPRTWKQFDRISGAGIPEGAYVVDTVMPGATRLRISKAAMGSANVRLFDADIARFSEPRGTFMRVDVPAGEPPPTTRRLPQGAG